jgi:hypothetical protein
MVEAVKRVIGGSLQQFSSLLGLPRPRQDCTATRVDPCSLSHCTALPPVQCLPNTLADRIIGRADNTDVMIVVN